MSILKYFSKLEPTLEEPKPEVERIRNSFKVWTDGSCISNGRKNAVGGIGVFLGDHSPHNISAPFKPHKGTVTNNICELEAVRRAILTLVNQQEYQLDDEIIIYTDSQYLINCITKWSNTWAQNGWQRKNSKGKKVMVKNKELIKEVKGLCQKYLVILTHCKAHTTFHGVIGSPEYVIWYGNKKADELAVAGSGMN